MIQPTRGQVEAQKRRYPKGCRVELIQMDDVHAPPTGTQGVVEYVDDTATVHVRWSTGSGLGAVFGVDIIVRIDEEAQPNGKM